MNGCVHQEECANQLVEDRAFGAVARVLLTEGGTTMVAGIPASDRLAQREQDRVQCPSPHSRRAHLRDAAGCVARKRNVPRVLRSAWWADCQVCVCWGVRARACVFKMYINKALCVCVCNIDSYLDFLLDFPLKSLSLPTVAFHNIMLTYTTHARTHTHTHTHTAAARRTRAKAREDTLEHKGLPL